MSMMTAYISQALARRDADEELAESIAEIYAEAGQPTEADRAWARSALDRGQPVVTSDPGDIRAIEPSLTLLSPAG